jgi:hypothetical protein
MGWGEGLLVLGSICPAQLRAAVEKHYSMELERRVVRLSCCCKVLADQDDRLLGLGRIRLTQWKPVGRHRSMELLDGNWGPSFLLLLIHLKR